MIALKDFYWCLQITILGRNYQASSNEQSTTPRPQHLTFETSTAYRSVSYAAVFTSSGEETQRVVRIFFLALAGWLRIQSPLSIVMISNFIDRAKSQLKTTKPLTLPSMGSCLDHTADLVTCICQ
ncbi:hypothetical protein CRM22_003402 [Opisthorchis felineus]|uniref:Uncharacterized protein n=1 Tax=Opisthorchis felineus TaxID=147828 RepID=A0A4S2M6B4_OPIFE|nr:hypothetical protein CRM22_003402 [Opisthorchis felineus]